MVGVGLAGIVLAGVLTTFLLLGRSGINLASYATMETQTRRGLEEFAQDVRMASAITWNSETSVTLTVPDNYTGTANQATYAWDTTTGSSTYHCFYRTPGTSSSANPRTTLVPRVTSFSFYRYDRLNASTCDDASTKRLQLEMTVTTTNTTVVDATDTTLSASFILRNKTSS